MNSLEKYLFNNQKEYMERSMERFENDFTTVAGRVVRLSAIISVDDNISTGFRYVKFLVINLDNKVWVLTVKLKLNDSTDNGVIIKEVQLKKPHLRPIYAIFYLLNQIREEKDKGNE